MTELSFHPLANVIVGCGLRWGVSPCLSGIPEDHRARARRAWALRALMMMEN
jgi:hypothetical protein